MPLLCGVCCDFFQNFLSFFFFSLSFQIRKSLELGESLDVTECGDGELGRGDLLGNGDDSSGVDLVDLSGKLSRGQSGTGNGDLGGVELGECVGIGGERGEELELQL